LREGEKSLPGFMERSEASDERVCDRGSSAAVF
jgi:hypothetical protein